jgi:hypothetical protein
VIVNILHSGKPDLPITYYVYLIGRNWLDKTSSGKNTRSANSEKFINEMENNKLDL